MAAAEARREDPRLESALRDVRAVAEAQARLLRVVEGISEELSRLGAEAGRLRAGELPAVQGPLQDLRRAWQRGEERLDQVSERLARHEAATAALAGLGGELRTLQEIQNEIAEVQRLAGEATSAHEADVLARLARLEAGGAGHVSRLEARVLARLDGLQERLDGLAARQEPPGSPAASQRGDECEHDAAGGGRPWAAACERHEAAIAELQRAVGRLQSAPALEPGEHSAPTSRPQALTKRLEAMEERLREEQARGQGEQLAELQAAKRELSELSGRQGRLQEQQRALARRLDRLEDARAEGAEDWTAGPGAR